MKKEIKLSGENTFFTGDLHLGHKQEFVWGARGFTSVEEHKAGVIKSINEHVCSSDNLINVGDFCLNSNEEDVLEYLNSIKCQNIFSLWGNHPNPLWSIYKREVAKQYGEGIEVYPFRFKSLIFIGDEGHFRVDGKIIEANHFPLQIWDFRKNGAWHICGHSHGGFEKTRAEYSEDLRLDVGWDQYKRPLSWSMLKDIMSKKRLGESLDHH